MDYAIDQEYLEGLNNLRNLLTENETNCDKLKRDFYDCEESSDEQFEKYLRNCNDTLLKANNVLKKSSVALKVYW